MVAQPCIRSRPKCGRQLLGNQDQPFRVATSAMTGCASSSSRRLVQGNLREHEHPEIPCGSLQKLRFECCIRHGQQIVAAP